MGQELITELSAKLEKIEFKLKDYCLVCSDYCFITPRAVPELQYMYWT